jgi:DNA-binding MarR family transcriptional regulator
MSTRQELISQLSEATQLVGNRTVLFTHVIADHIGLSATEFECLDFLQACGPVPVGRLAELTGLTSGAVTGLVDRLEKAGFVRRRPDPGDRRKVIVEVVPQDGALEKVRRLYEPVSAGFNDMVTRYSDDDIEVITKYLQDSIIMIDSVITRMTGRSDLPGRSS